MRSNVVICNESSTNSVNTLCHEKCSLHTLWRVDVNKVRLCSEHDLLQNDSEAVDVSFLSSVDRSSCHTQQLRCCPQLITVKRKLIHLHQKKRSGSAQQLH